MNADFVLVTNEIVQSVAPHLCEVTEWVTSEHGTEACRVQVYPPLPPYGSKQNVGDVLLAPKWVGSPLRPLGEPLVGVFVIREARVTRGDDVDWLQVEILDWGLVFKSPAIAYEWKRYWAPVDTQATPT